MEKQPCNLPLITLVIPVYNGSEYIRESIESVLQQSYPHIELLVIDDGSTDNTREILKKYQNQFYWESQKNCGQSATLNKGWGMAKGEFLSYLSADDLLKPDAIKVSIEYLLENPKTVLTYPDYFLIDTHGKLIKKVSAPEFDYEQLLTQFVVQPGPGIVFRRSAFQQIGGWNTTLRQMPDYDYWLRLGLLGHFKHLPETLAKFRVHEGSQTYAPSSVEKSEESLHIMNAYFSNPHLPEKWLACKSLAFSSAHLIAARLHIRAGRYFLGLRHFIHAAQKDKRVLFSLRTLKLLGNALKYRVLRLFRINYKTP